MIHVVKSRDGVEFTVTSDARSVPYDRAYAALRTAAELESHGDFDRVVLFTEPLVASSSAAEQLPVKETVAGSIPASPATDVEALERARARWGAAAFVWGNQS